MESHKFNKDFNESAFGSGIWAQALAATQSPNESGTTPAEYATLSQSGTHPRLVTRGESFEVHEAIGDDGETYCIVIQGGRPKVIHIPKPKTDGVSDAAIVDYLNCSFPFKCPENLNQSIFLSQFFTDLFKVVGITFAPAIERGGGLYGYKKSYKLGNSSALFAFDGNNDTAFLSFSGESCHQIPNWPDLVDYLQNQLQAHITRWDGAYDDFEGKHTVDSALEMYQAGLFNSGGRTPLMDQRGNWVKPDGRGRTLYIGSGKNGKLIRIYEKGMQLGIPYHPWVRWEAQLGNRDREIPWDTVLHPGKYLAGTYPKAMGWISEVQSRIKTLQKTASIGYEHLINYASIAYGKQINLMMIKEGSAEKVIEILRRQGFPSRVDLPELPNYGKVMP